MVSLADMLHKSAVADHPPLTKQRLFAAYRNVTPVASTTVNTSLDEMFQARDIIIGSRQGAPSLRQRIRMDRRNRHVEGARSFLDDRQAGGLGCGRGEYPRRLST